MLLLEEGCLEFRPIINGNENELDGLIGWKVFHKFVKEPRLARFLEQIRLFESI